MKNFSRVKKMKVHYVKDGINDFVVQGNKDAVNPEKKVPKLQHIIR